MRRHTLVVSDVHLAAPAEDERDRLLARTIDLAQNAAHADHAHLELVLNGDLFDLDAPPEQRPADAATYDACRGPGAPALMRRVLEAHPRVVDVLRRVLVAGNRLVVVPGNHDAQLVLPGVRVVLSDALRTRGNEPLFRSWFHQTPDGVHVEHGHQYDPLCVMERMYPEERPGAEGLGVIHRLEDTVGSVGTHHGTAIFSQMNPYAADPLAGVRGRDVLAALRASLMQGEMTRVLGATRDLMLVRRRAGPGAAAADADRLDALWLDAVARETGAPRGTLGAHRALFAPKADASDVAIAATREYDYGADVDARLRAAMGAIARLHGARAVVTGHTHDAWLERHRPTGAWLVNAGSWAPSSLEPRGRTGAPGEPRREVVGTFAHIRNDAAAPGVFAVGLHTVWPDGSIT